MTVNVPSRSKIALVPSARPSGLAPRGPTEVRARSPDAVQAVRPSNTFARHPSLVRLVGILARQAALEFHDQAWATPMKEAA